MSHKRSRGNGQGSLYQRGGAGPWYAEWFDHAGKRHRHCTKTTNKAAAQRILAEKLKGVALRRDGIIDARQEAMSMHARTAIEKHLADFQAMLRARRRSEGHVRRTALFIREVCTAKEFQKPSEINADGVNKFIADLRDKGSAPRTVQGRIVAIKAFTKWLAEHDKLSHYGHLLPDQHPEAVGGFAAMMTAKFQLTATGTAGQEERLSDKFGSQGAVQGAVGMREKDPPGANICDGMRTNPVSARNATILPIAELCEQVRTDAKECDWPRWESNPHEGYPSGDFKSPVSTVPPRGRHW
jgi:hypothetical protein